MYTVFDAHLLRLPDKTEEMLDFICDYGIEGVGVDLRLMDDERAALETAKKVWDRGLGWGILRTPVDFYAAAVTDEIFEDALKTFQRHCGVAEKMGVRYCYNHVWSSSDERQYEENFAWHVRRIQRVSRIASEHGIRYGLEFLGPHELRRRYRHEFVHTINGVLALADAAGGKAGFLFDTYHWYCEGARMDDLYFALQHVERMCGFHVNDGIPGRTREEQKDFERAMPLTSGVIDSKKPYALFEKHGYVGPVVCEPTEPCITMAKSMTLEECVKLYSDAYQRLKS